MAASPGDRAASTRLRMAETTRHEAFQTGTSRIRARMSRAGDAGWFGAFTEGGDLAAELGIVLCDEGVARYQSVLTGSDHRRRGLTSHLLGVAADWAMGPARRDGSLTTRLVIVADADSDAGRLYSRRGFTLAGHSYGAYRDGASA